jgi:hypothetical protein
VILKMYSVYDKKALLFGQPNFMLNDQLALRSFSDGVRDTTNAIGKHPDDYALYELGSYNEVNGSIETVTPPLLIAEAIQFKAPDIKVA